MGGHRRRASAPVLGGSEASGDVAKWAVQLTVMARGLAEASTVPASA
jgi:hypothetical protein